ncbi:MAG: glycosyltransferase family 4 protein [Patescibacteria group bacterium]|nr:glycosyltransferase family 4 protein [Patescibacteria group bacterium]MBU2508852.1 glycosyltransferase family 4 protein [Patescibacteria group bacterium]
MSKITLITLDYPPLKGGIARYLSELVKASNGEMEVITPEDRNFFRNKWPRWKPIVDICLSLKNKERVILLSHVFPVGTAAWLAKRKGGPDYAVLFHGLDLRLVKGLWKKWLLKQICANAKLLIVNSESTRSDLRTLVPSADPLDLTPGVDEQDIPSREKARELLEITQFEKIVVSLARLVPRKGIDNALHAMSRLQKKMDVPYVVLGDGPDRDRLIRLALEHRTQVKWIRNASDEEKWLWLAAADVFLLPVRDEGEDVEGFGIVYLEAAKAGIPSVAGKSGGATEAVKHNKTGFLVRPNDVDDIEEAVEKLLKDEELRKKLGEEAKKRVEEEFGWGERWRKLACSLIGH